MQLEPLDRDRLIEAVFRALRDFDRAKRTAHDLRMINRGQGPTIKHGTGRVAQALYVTDAVLTELRKQGEFDV